MFAASGDKPSAPYQAFAAASGLVCSEFSVMRICTGRAVHLGPHPRGCAELHGLEGGTRHDDECGVLLQTLIKHVHGPQMKGNGIVFIALASLVKLSPLSAARHRPGSPWPGALFPPAPAWTWHPPNRRESKRPSPPLK